MKIPYEAFAVECNSGWKSLYQPLLDLCQLYGIHVQQVKEKFGGLRFYISGDRADELYPLIAAAEAASIHICEDCGITGMIDPNSHRATIEASATSGWIRTLCKPCRTKWDESRLNRT